MIKKSLLLVSLICFNYVLCFSQSFPKKQTLILLSNLSGVPFYKDVSLNDIGVNGFEVDDKGNFYFFGGEKTACLAAFSGDRQLFRKPYRELNGGSELHLYKNNFYSFNFDQKGDPIFIKINMTDGSLSVINNNLAKKKYFQHAVLDTCIILEQHGEGRDSVFYEQYSFNGTFIKRVPNLNNLPFANLPDNDCEFLGKWNDNYVFHDVTGDKLDQDTFWLLNREGKILAKKSISRDNVIFGRGYSEEPLEDRKVRNGSLYVLGRKGHFALITEVPLQTFFYNIH